MPADARAQFLALIATAVGGRTLAKLTLGKYRGSDATLRNVFIRLVDLKSGPHLAFVWRHATRDVTKNYRIEDGLQMIERLLGTEFWDAHLFAAEKTAHFESTAAGAGRLKLEGGTRAPIRVMGAHDRPKTHPIPANAPWLHALGVTNTAGQPREGMADKFRQIQKFAELLTHLFADAPLPSDRPIQVVDMGSGKGYLTFAVAALLGERVSVRGVEARPELVELCNRVAQQHGFAPRLSFAAGSIADANLEACDVLIALHACDTATDDALARGIAAGAKLLVVAPCCQKELRRQLIAPPVLEPALRHGIFQERQAEFVTDALRAQLLEWGGYRTKVFEFISSDHTAKNLMIAAIQAHAPADPGRAESARKFAAFYGIREQRLAVRLGFELSPGT